MSVPHNVVRLDVSIDQDFERFCAQYESLVPELDVAAITSLVQRRAPWSDVLEQTVSHAPHGFIIYWKNDVSPVMALAGDEIPCKAYLMGNHTIAQRMFHLNPVAMLYAPLRTVVYSDRYGQTRFAVDQPSTVFCSFDCPEIAVVGVELDNKLALLFEALEIPIPSELTAHDSKLHT